MNIVITGHVDHGKSTLIGRLLFDTNSIPETVIEEAKRSSKRADGSLEFAYLLDSLEEERAKNITIDASRTFFKSPKRRYTIIDAPGHKEFLKNMVTGASQADAAILIIDASRGVEEQTKRHAFVLKLLGIQKIIVAVNKLDLIGFEQSKVTPVVEEIEKFLTSLEITPQAVVPIAAMEGDNLASRSKRTPWYTGPCIIEVLDSFEERRDLSGEPIRFVVQSVLPQNGSEMILGRVESGVLKTGGKLRLLPSGREITVNGIKVMDGSLKEAPAGKSVALTVDAPEALNRGAVLCDGPSPTITKSFKSSIFCLSPNGIPAEKTFTLKCATQAIPCKVKGIYQKMNSSSLEQTGRNSDKLDETEVGEVIIETEYPVIVENFSKIPALGRFVLQDSDHICAAGIIREVSAQ
ncbi:MAG: GTP-binding protein [Deltaproteobacteria bacterium]|nr:GTP-binding protein [Deltaproteobacteria bacterium]